MKMKLGWEFNQEQQRGCGLLCEKRRKVRSNDDNDNDEITSSSSIANTIVVIVPFLSTTEILLKRLGYYNHSASANASRASPFEKDNDNDDNDDNDDDEDNDDNDDDDNDDELHSHHHLSDLFMFALDDIRDMRHRSDENVADDDDEEGDDDEEEGNNNGGNNNNGKGNKKNKKDYSNKKIRRRSNFQIDNLKRQRLKLLKLKQKQRQKQEQKQQHKHEKNEEKETTTKEWIRIVQTYNSIRILLFLLSNPKQIILKQNNHNHNDIATIINNPYLLQNCINRLTESLSCLITLTTTTTTSSSNSSTVSGGGYCCCCPSASIKDIWVKHIINVIQIQSTHNVDDGKDDVEDEVDVDVDVDVNVDNYNHNHNHNHNLDNSIICLTDDSSDDDDDDDDVSDDDVGIDNTATAVKTYENENENDTREATTAADAKADADADNVRPHSYDYYCTLWNARLDEIMKELLSAMTMMVGINNSTNNNNNSNIPSLEKPFGSLAIETSSTKNERGGGLCDSISTAAKARAKKLDKKFSLLVDGQRDNNNNNNRQQSQQQSQQQRQQYLRSIEKLRSKIEYVIRNGPKIYHDAQLEVYGSCLSGLSLGKNADVDLSLSFQDAIDKRHKFLYEEKPKKMITAKKYNKSITETIYGIGRRLSVRDADFMNIETIPRARVPVIKGIYKNANNPHSIDGSLHFDICILNNIAIANSSLIKEYSEIDSRVKSLMILIKKWTKHYSINSAQNNYLSSYTWMNLVIFYLQCIHFVPNLQCSELMDRCSVDDNNNGFQYDPINNKNHNINNLNTSYLKWKNQAERYWKRSNDIDEHYGSVSILLHGFFHFYSNEFASHLYMISIKRGGGGMNTNNLLPKTMFMDQSTSLSFCIEDPFETYDSHFPHDLAAALDEKGSIFLNRCFHDSAEYLHKIIFDDNHNEGVNIDDDIDALWPDVVILDTGSSNEGRKRRSKRSSPDCTLLIKNLKVDNNIGSGNDDDDGEDAYYDAIEQELANIFQLFAVQTNTNFVRTNLSRGDRTLAYVDYDSVDPVLAVLKHHAKTPLVLNGNTLEIIQKSNQNKQKSTTGGGKKKKNGRKQNNTDNNNSAANASTRRKNNNDGGKKKTLPAKNKQETVPSSSVGVGGGANPLEKHSKTTAIHKEEEDKTLTMKDHLQKFRSYTSTHSTGSHDVGKNEKTNHKDNANDDVGKEIERGSNSKDNLVSAARKESRASKNRRKKKTNSITSHDVEKNEIEESFNSKESRASKNKKKTNNRHTFASEKNSKDTNNNNARSIVKGICHSCGKPGHYIRECPFKKFNAAETATATKIPDVQDGSGSTKTEAGGDRGDSVVNQKNRNGNVRGRRGGRAGRGRGGSKTKTS